MLRSVADFEVTRVGETKCSNLSNGIWSSSQIGIQPRSQHPKMQSEWHPVRKSGILVVPVISIFCTLDYCPKKPRLKRVQDPNPWPSFRSPLNIPETPITFKTSELSNLCTRLLAVLRILVRLSSGFLGQWSEGRTRFLL